MAEERELWCGTVVVECGLMMMPIWSNLATIKKCPFLLTLFFSLVVRIFYNSCYIHQTPVSQLLSQGCLEEIIIFQSDLQ